ncbi:hypothetical protein AX17_002114 [Amanita inopinata Kibby_2008]|nr:hypothetical protein AX17_002114 [Amanita inopinata Kibby_2008]
MSHPNIQNTMSAEPRTPPARPPNARSRRASRRSSTNKQRESLPPRVSFGHIERSPTLVADSPPEFSSKAISPPLTNQYSQTSVARSDTLVDIPVTPCPSASARKKPHCQTCGKPMKGHKRGQCRSPPPKGAYKSLYTSSPETERSPPPKGLAKPEFTVIETPSRTVAAVPASVSTSRRRKSPKCRTCGTPMKGHKRPFGTPQCPTVEFKNAASPDSPSNLKSSATAPPLMHSRHEDGDIQMPLLGASSLFSRSPGSSGKPVQLTLTPTNRRRRHAVTPISQSVQANHTGSAMQISPAVQTPSPKPRQQRRSGKYRAWDHNQKTPSPPSQDMSISSSITAFAPSSVSQSPPVQNTLVDLINALGEPTVMIYEVSNHNEAVKIRNKARHLSYNSGIVHLRAGGKQPNGGEWKAEEEDDFTHVLSGKGWDRMGMMGIGMDVEKEKGKAQREERDRSCRKWIFIARDKEVVKKCVGIYEGRV